MVYIANSGSSFVSAINGATNATTSITGAGTNCVAAAVNPATDMIYLANSNGSAVIINGTSNSASSLTAGTNPCAVAVNQVTDMIYVANYGSANVTVISGPGPGQPVLSSPSNGATGQMSALTLSWTSASGATSYTVQVSTGSSFSTTIVAHSGAGLSATASGLAYGGKTYYWRAGAVNAGGTDWSSEWSFVTLTVPAAPELESPGSGSVYERATAINFVWNYVATAVTYTLQLSTTFSDSNFASTIFSESLQADSCDYPNKLGSPYGINLYWRVSATNAAGTGPWSIIYRLIPATSVVPSPILKSAYGFSMKNGAIA